eukprot:TRINITY_DN967_c0_g3_i1.p1 TRINITY_DN967_c0_g3~~TRINITY_DN967_c0_g3_i1.p1  ORF type:complete len:925 (+),score=266.47 TRINITY_DN967_c0_g3_i1:69-2777(+)
MPPAQTSAAALNARGYERIRVLGRGSFGEATLVRHRGRGLVVSKRVQISNLSKKEVEEAENEIGILRKLSHPNIVRYIDSFSGDGCLFIIMEFADGGDLSQRLRKQRGWLEEDQVQHMFVQLCLAVKHLHDQHILHRDLKTQNIFLTSHRTHPLVKLGDFGISTQLRNTLALAKTMCGTPYYFSPELCQNKPYNNKTDIWSCGCILYELCTLRHAFDGSNMQSLMARIIRGTYQKPPPHYTEPLRRLIDQMLVRDPRQRPSVNRVLALDWVQARVRRIVEEKTPEPAPATPPSRRSSGSGGVPKPRPGERPRRARPPEDPLDRSKVANDQFQKALERQQENRRGRPAAPPAGHQQQAPARPRSGGAVASDKREAVAGMDRLQDQLAAVSDAIAKRMADRDRAAEKAAAAARERAREREREQERERERERRRIQEVERQRQAKAEADEREAKRLQRGQAALAAERQRLRDLQVQQEQTPDPVRRRAPGPEGDYYWQPEPDPEPAVIEALRRDLANVPVMPAPRAGGDSRCAQLRGYPPADGAAAFRDVRAQAEYNRRRPADPFAPEHDRARQAGELRGRLGLRPAEDVPPQRAAAPGAGRQLDLEAVLAKEVQQQPLHTDVNLRERLEAERAKELWERQRRRIEARRSDVENQPVRACPSEQQPRGDDEIQEAEAAWRRMRGRIDQARQAAGGSGAVPRPPSSEYHSPAAVRGRARARTPPARDQQWSTRAAAAAAAQGRSKSNPAVAAGTEEAPEDDQAACRYGADYDAMRKHFSDAVLGSALGGADDDYFEEAADGATSPGQPAEQVVMICGSNITTPVFCPGNRPVGGARRAAELRAFLEGALGADRVGRAVAALADTSAGDAAAEAAASALLTGGLPNTDDLLPLLSQMLFCEQIAAGV